MARSAGAILHDLLDRAKDVATIEALLEPWPTSAPSGSMLRIELVVALLVGGLPGLGIGSGLTVLAARLRGD